jgi:hypothetical protein
LTSSAQAEQLLSFPVVVSPPDRLEAPLADEVLFSQQVRSAGAVTVSRDTSIQVPTRPGAPDSPTVAQGTMFFVAVMETGPAYCAAVVWKKSDLFQSYDIGLCLRDSDADGVFDRQVTFSGSPLNTTRTVYEIAVRQKRPPDWTATAVPYQAAPLAAVPFGELRVSNPRGFPQNYLTLDLCWSKDLVLPVWRERQDPFCGYAIPPGPVASEKGQLFFKPGEPSQELSWGTVKVRLTNQAGDARAIYSSPLSAGRASVALYGKFKRRFDDPGYPVFSIMGGGSAPADHHADGDAQQPSGS